MGILKMDVGLMSNMRPGATVSTKEARDLWELFDSEVYIQSAYRLMETALFGSGIEILSANQSKNVDPLFAALVPEFWTPFLRDVLPDLIVYGYVVWTQAEAEYTVAGNKRSRTPLYIPVVVPRSCYSLKVVIKEDYSKAYEVRPINDEMYADSSLHVFVMPGRAPDVVTGQHRSLLSSLNYQAKRLRMLESWFDRATQQRSHPPLMYEEAEKPAGIRQPFAGLVFDHDLNNVVSKEAGMEGTEPSSSSEVSLRAANDIRDEQTVFSNSTRKRMSALHTPEDNCHFVPSGYKVADKPVPMPESQPDLLSYTDAYRDRVYAVFQIPVTIAFAQLSTKSGSSSALAIDDSEMQRFNRLLQTYQASLLRLCDIAYAEILEGGDDGIEFKLPIFTHLSITQILALSDQDVISDKDAKKMTLRVSGLEEKFLFNGKNEHVRPRMGGNENMTRPMMEARIGNIKAETELFEAQLSEVKAGVGKIKSETALNKKEERMPASASS